MIRAAVRATGTRLGPLRRVGVSAPGVIHADGRTMSTAHNLGDDGPFDLLTPLEAAVDAPVVLDNNVNLAALGERWRGHAGAATTFAFLAVTPPDIDLAHRVDAAIEEAGAGMA